MGTEDGNVRLKMLFQNREKLPQAQTKLFAVIHYPELEVTRELSKFFDDTTLFSVLKSKQENSSPKSK